MKHTFIKWPSIDQLRHLVREGREAVQWSGKDEDGVNVFDRNKPLPVVELKGTVKIHGTNAGINMNPEGVIAFQSRSRVLRDGDDNARICQTLGPRSEEIALLINRLTAILGLAQDKTTVLFGEWFGGNIQAGVGVNGLPLEFAYFGLAQHDEETGITTWHDTVIPDLVDVNCPEANIYNIGRYGIYTATLDLARPELVQNDLIALTESVEANCPVAEFHGKPNTTGEGIVWTTLVDGRHMIAKIKGEKHSASKVRTLAPVDVEKYNKIVDLVESVVTINRLEQMYRWMADEDGLEQNERNTGHFLRLVFADVQKEEADTITASELPEKDLNRAISNKAREWYFTQVRTA